MHLQRRLDAIRTGFERQLDAATVDIMHAATTALVDSGQAGRARGEGDVAPDFELANTEGDRVGLTALRAQGPVVLTFFRGHW